AADVNEAVVDARGGGADRADPAPRSRGVRLAARAGPACRAAVVGDAGSGGPAAADRQARGSEAIRIADGGPGDLLRGDDRSAEGVRPARERVRGGETGAGGPVVLVRTARVGGARAHPCEVRAEGDSGCQLGPVRCPRGHRGGDAGGGSDLYAVPAARG